MFKKDQNGQTPSTHAPAPPTSPGRKPVPPRGAGSAVIGPSITIKGDVSGDEDLVILGKVQGTVNLTKNNVTIGQSGKVKADVRGKNLIVEGEVDGDLKAQEQIILRNTARVEGSISAPRVALEDGAVFRGGIEMDSASKINQESQPAKPESQPAKPAPVKGNGRDKDKEPETTAGPQPGTSGKGLSA